MDYTFMGCVLCLSSQAPRTQAKAPSMKAHYASSPVHPAHDHPESVLDDTVSRCPWAPLLAGAAVGIIGWIVTFPFDVLKTRLQASIITRGTHTGMGLGLSSRTWPCLARSKVSSGHSQEHERGNSLPLGRTLPRKNRPNIEQGRSTQKRVAWPCRWSGCNLQ